MINESVDEGILTIRQLLKVSTKQERIGRITLYVVGSTATATETSISTDQWIKMGAPTYIDVVIKAQKSILDEAWISGLYSRNDIPSEVGHYA